MWRLCVLVVTALCTSASRAQNDVNTTSESVFVSPAADVAFVLNVPRDSSQDLYFHLLMPTRVSWAAIGLGSHEMAGSLMLMAYSSSNRQNVTLSPRTADGHSEPVYLPDIDIDTLSGTGLVNETVFVFNGRCSNCRSWSVGSVDVNSTAQSFLYATGPDGSVDSDDPGAAVKMHYNYGTFTMDMVHATGLRSSSPGTVDLHTRLLGATEGLAVVGSRDMVAMAHAVIMVFCFVGLLPFGTLVLRLGNRVRWHAVNQGLALLGVVIGTGLGIRTSFSYNRSKTFRNAHQVIGLFVFLGLVIQFAAGYMMHHRELKQTRQRCPTQEPTQSGSPHVWFGRLIIMLGVINAFLGFSFALSPSRNYILGGLVICIFPPIIIILLLKKCVQRRWGGIDKAGGDPAGYYLEPWPQTQAQTTAPPKILLPRIAKFRIDRNRRPEWRPGKGSRNALEKCESEASRATH